MNVLASSDVRIRHALGHERVLQALNLVPPSADRIAHFQKRWTEGDHQLEGKDTEPFFFALRAQHLRRFVDEWLGTGMHKDGSERPYDRDVFRAVHTIGAVTEYISKTPPKVALSPVDGRFGLAFGNYPRGEARAKDPFEGARIDALRYFVEILASDWRNSLCKCRYQICGQYFLLKRPRRKYKNGTFCTRRQSLAAASQHIRKSRLLAERELIELAAKQLCGRKNLGPNWHDDLAEKRKLATLLRRSRLCQVRGILLQSNWVSRHSKQMERKRLELLAEL